MQPYLRIILFTSAIAQSVQGFAQGSARKLPAAPTTTPPTIDGRLDDAVWAQLPAQSGFTNQVSGEPGSLPTQSWITYDQNFIYVAFQCDNPNPNGILARDVLPGSQMQSDDHVGFQIDPFFSRSGTRSTFKVNPLGTQSEELAGGRAGKREWRGAWQSAVQRTEFGYTVEMAIPWPMLNHPEGTKTVSINMFRNCPSQATAYFWSDLGRPNRPENDGIWEGVTMPKPEIDRRPQLLGYVNLEGQRSPDFVRSRAGLDAKMRLSESLTAIGTVFPDFQNIEQQVESVGFTRTERFQGDSRPFFAEGGQMFSMLSTFGIGRAFYSRRIREIDFAGKVYGQLNADTQLGALAAVSPNSEFNFAGRVGKTFGSNGGASAYATAHQAPNRNEVFAGSTAWRRFGNHSFWGHVGMLDGNTKSAKTFQLSADYDGPNIFHTLTYRSVPQDFNPYLGLIGFRGYTGAFSFLDWKSRPSKGPIEEVSFNHEASLDHKFDGSVQQRGMSAYVNTKLRSYHSFGFGLSSYQFPDSTDRSVSANYGFSRRDPYNAFGMGVRLGSRGTQKVTAFDFGVTRRPMPKLDLSVRYFQERAERVASQLVGAASYQFDPKRSISTRVVQSNGHLNTYFAYREAGFEGSELFVILGDPNAQSFRTRLVLKWVTPIRW